MAKFTDDAQWQRLEQIADYLFRKKQGQLTEEEETRLQEWLAESGISPSDLRDLQDPDGQRTDIMRLHRFESTKRLEEVLARGTRSSPSLEPSIDGRVEVLPRRSWTWLRSAAAVFVFLGIGFLAWRYLSARFVGSSASEQIAYAVDKSPGTNQAYLKLADGTTVKLDSSKNGIEMGEELKYSDGSVLLEVQSLASRHGEGATAASDLVELNVPRGGQYNIKLMDGTVVWVNAGSTLIYPINFAADIREVTLLGEAYFEVAHRSNQPFVVHTGPQQVRVLGTTFNINAYHPESQVRTTLLSGRVRVDRASERVELQPGQQVLALPHEPLKAQRVSVEDVIAWKDGLFMFNNEALQDVMEKVARWYDMDVEFAATHLKQEKVYGSISRSENLSQVLKMLEKADVAAFETKPGCILVMPK